MSNPLTRKPVTTFGRYTVVERIGSGGMATVDLAKLHGRNGFERKVALKRMLPMHASNSELRALFVREAKLAARLRHGNIAQLTELGDIDGTLYIAMEYVPGKSLHEFIKSMAKTMRRIPTEVVVSMLYDVLDALDYAHTLTDETGYPLGLIHRDICPTNLVLTPYGSVKLIDFGVASEAFSNETSTGIRGKLAYLPPESRTGHVDARGDLFSLGVVAHELLTGQSKYSLLNSSTGELPVASSVNSSVPRELDDWVRRAVQRDPRKRFQTARSMRAALLEVARKGNMYPDQRRVAEWQKNARRSTARRAQGTVPATKTFVDESIEQLAQGKRYARTQSDVVPSSEKGTASLRAVVLPLKNRASWEMWSPTPQPLACFDDWSGEARVPAEGAIETQKSRRQVMPALYGASFVLAIILAVLLAIAA